MSLFPLTLPKGTILRAICTKLWIVDVVARGVSL
jgi:hypothetical protein